MATPSGECKACGCGLNHADVRQLALYYRQEQPSLVAVQYVCPRCGHSEWRHQRPADLAAVEVRVAALASGPHSRGRVGREKRKTPTTGTGATCSSLRIGDVRPLSLIHISISANA